MRSTNGALAGPGVLGVLPLSRALATQNSCLASCAFLFREKQTRFTFWSKCRRQKISVEIWLQQVVSIGRKLWIKVASLIPGKRSKLFEEMSHSEGSSGCEWVRLESILWICEFGPVSGQENNEDCACQRPWCPSQVKLRECICSDFGQISGFCRLLFSQAAK